MIQIGFACSLQQVTQPIQEFYAHSDKNILNSIWLNMAVSVLLHIGIENEKCMKKKEEKYISKCGKKYFVRQRIFFGNHNDKKNISFFLCHFIL